MPFILFAILKKKKKKMAFTSKKKKIQISNFKIRKKERKKSGIIV